VQFSDTEGNFMDSKQDTYAQNTYTEAAVHDYLDTSYAKSLVSYMDTISYGQFHVNTYMPQLNEAKTAIAPITLTGTQSSYDSNEGIYLAEKEAMDLAKASYTLTSLNLDQTGDGYVDNVTFIFAGTESARGGTFYAHKNDFPVGYSINSKDVGCINVLMAETVFGTDFSSTGEIAHEFLHSIGYPDLYHEDGGTPVGTWDIMSQASLYNQWPLAYMRSSVSNWLTIDTITSSQHLTLVPSSEKDGNQAYILKTSISDSEFFVVEYRKQGKQYSDELDVKIPGSGLIIYRINQRSENLTNRLGNGVDGVYVFRPGETNTAADAGDMTESFLSSESGRTSYGTEDMSKGIADNAIVYSDGQNSGIAIRNVSSASDTISFDVSFADTSNIGLWNSLGGSSVASNTNSNVLSMAVNGNDSYPSALIGNSSTLALYQYNGSSWVKSSADITDFGSAATLAYLNGIPYILYSETSDFKMKLIKYTDGTWKTVQIISSKETDYSSMMSTGNALYLAWNEGSFSGSYANKIGRYDGTKLTLLEETSTGYYTQYHFSSDSTSVYLSYRDASNSSNTVSVRQITGSNIKNLPAPETGSVEPQVCSDGENLYLLNAAENTSNDSFLYKYSDDRTTLTKISSRLPAENSVFSSISIYQGVPLVQIVDNKKSGSSGTSVYRFENNAWWQEGLKLDPTVVSDTNMLMIGNTCYVSFLSSSVPYIKAKQITVNQSGQSTPTVSSIIASASKTAYKIGDSFNANDLTVKAQYSDLSSKTLSYQTDYTISGFNTSTAGTKTVTVKYGSFTDTYQITVSAIAVTGVKVNGTLSLTAGNSGQLSAAVSPSNATNKKVSWSSSNTSVASVDGNGKVTAKSAGKASITVATADGNYKASCSVTVSAASAATPKPTNTPTAAPTEVPAHASVSYQTHVQNVGWQNYVSDGSLAGTTGQALRLEGIRIRISGNVSGSIQYRTHVQNIGWQDWKSNDAMSGTQGQALRLEGIQIRLTGDLAAKYDIYYQVHAQNLGWLGWVENGAAAGSEGFSYRLEGIRIVLVAKNGSAPGSTASPFASVYTAGNVRYRTHVQDVGWQNYVSDGTMSGTQGRSLRLEGINISLSPNISGGIEYCTHVQNIGWQNYVSNGSMSGTQGQALRLEAIQIRLTGAAADQYDVYYQVHCQNIGWMGWAKNGEKAGTAGFGYRLEGIRIKLVPKGGSAPESSKGAFQQK
jgi:M6 family metalloprotease-like protein